MKHICKNCHYYTGRNYITQSKNCSCPKMQYKGMNDEMITKSDIMMYWDGECYVAGFYVGEDFGCIHWKEKTKKENKLPELSCHHNNYEIKAIKNNEILKITEKYYPEGNSIFWYEDEKGIKLSKNKHIESLLWNLLDLKERGYKIYARKNNLLSNKWKEIK